MNPKVSPGIYTWISWYYYRERHNFFLRLESAKAFSVCHVEEQWCWMYLQEQESNSADTEKKLQANCQKEKWVLPTSHKRTYQCNKTVSTMNDNSFKCKIKCNFVQIYYKEFSKYLKKKSKLKGRVCLEVICSSQQRAWWKLQHSPLRKWISNLHVYAVLFPRVVLNLYKPSGISAGISS